MSHYPTAICYSLKRYDSPVCEQDVIDIDASVELRTLELRFDMNRPTLRAAVPDRYKYKSNNGRMQMYIKEREIPKTSLSIIDQHCNGRGL
jgi:hypothetical protein